MFSRKPLSHRDRVVAIAIACACAVAVASVSTSAFAGAKVTSTKGDVRTRGPKEKSYAPAAPGAEIPDGARVRTGEDGEATIRFADGTETKVRPKSEIIVRAARAESSEPSAAVLFFGRLWSKVAKSGGADKSFEVRSANAVAGVRGTEFEVGVADDGSTRVVVSEGSVGVEGEDEGEPALVKEGYEIESDGEGKLAGSKKAAKDPDWEGWFTKRARELEKRGVKIARHLDGRLNQRKAKVERLVAEQRALRQDIERLEKKKGEGADVDQELTEKLAKLEKVTHRLVDMKRRLQGAFGMFERWGAIAKKGGLDGAEELGRMADNIAKIAADFADMIEEGTDLSPEGMEDMMNDMKKGKTGRPKQNAGDELF